MSLLATIFWMAVYFGSAIALVYILGNVILLIDKWRVSHGRL